MSQPTRPGEERLEISAAMADLRIGRWDDVRDLLMVRLRPCAEVSVLARTCNPRLAFDVGLQIGSGAVTPEPELPDEWGVGVDLIWRTAIANTKHRLRPEPVIASAGGFDVTILSAGLFTTGVLADLDHHLIRLGIEPSGRQIFATALTATVVTVIEPKSARDCSAHDDVDRLRVEASARDFCATLRAATGDPLPTNLFGARGPGCSRFDVQGSFASGRILE